MSEPHGLRTPAVWTTQAFRVTAVGGALISATGLDMARLSPLCRAISGQLSLADV